MQPFQEFIGQELIWIPKSPLPNHHEVRVGDAVLATLDTRRPITAVVAEGSFIMKEEGVFRKRFSVHAQESGPALATYTGGWGTNTLPWRDGLILQWGNPMWGGKGGWKDMAGLLFIHFHRRSITLYPQAAMLPDLSILVALGLYMTLRQARLVLMSAAG